MQKIIKWAVSLLFLSGTAQSFAQELEYELLSLGKAVNSAYHDSAPVISADGKTLYFFVNDHHDNNVKGHSQDIWYCERDSMGVWGEAKHMGRPFNAHRFNQVFTVGPDGSWLLVRGGNGGKNAYRDISIVNIINGEWQRPNVLSVKDFHDMSRGSYFGAAISSDQQFLLIYMSETKGSKYSDLYLSKRLGSGDYDRPVLISSLSTKRDEFGPFIAADDRTVYFASDRPGGHGNMDIYKAERLDDTWMKWSEPINLGAPVNTSGFDAYYSVDATGKEMYTTRAYMSADGGSLDIFSLVPVPVAEVQPLIVLKGNVFNAKTNAVVKADIRIIPKQGLELSAASSAFDGSYASELPNEGRYRLEVSAQGYLHHSDSMAVAYSETDVQFRKDFYLEPIEIGSTVRLDNIFFDFDRTELRSESFTELENVVNFLKQNPTVKIEIRGHTDDKGSDDYNLSLSDGRANAVMDYLKEQWLASERIKANGYGESMPMVSNDTDENRQVNRRVEFVVIDK